MGGKVVILALVALLVIAVGSVSIIGNLPATGNMIATGNGNTETTAPVKEFSIDSFLEVNNGEFFPQFSVKELTVNKGDLVRIKVNVINGRHDFKLDEFGVFVDTPTGEETVVEFVADEAGEFIYYCNQPGHRAAGQWGTLKVLG